VYNRFTRDRGLATLHNEEVQHREVVVDDAATDRLALLLTSTALAVALAPLGEEEADTLRREDALHHGETLLVITTSDSEAVTHELVPEGVTIDLLRHALVEEGEELLVVIDFDALLEARFRACHVELHLCESAEKQERSLSGLPHDLR